ncbi:MAG TPA: VIT1/CCC1 transporter family protein [Candidatus Nanopelagicales bacterium]|nr:VIT1/CCC1 transporter family protein [Candidatus Nanopelagicales bacterium]
MTSLPHLDSPALGETTTALRMERDAIHLYDGLARIERDPHRAEAFRTIAADERRHAEVWEGRLRDAGVTIPTPGGPGPRMRFILVVARVLGTRAVGDLVRTLEGNDERRYAKGAPTAPSAGMTAAMAAMAADERRHAETWRRLEGKPTGDEAAATTVDAERRGRVAASVAEITKAESWHRGGAGTLRAIVFGASDGLVSNLSLVMGIAGATAEPSIILLSGIAGLLAGAFSMAAGEYISVRSQVEVLERQIALERAELAAIPEEEFEELVAIYRSKGLPEADARRFAEHIFQDPEVALQTLVREELGLDMDGMSSPWAAAGGSFVAFTIGAIIPVIPYLFGGGDLVLFVSFGASLAALFLLGALVSLLTGRNLVFSGMRQVGLGAAAAIVTFMVGRLIGVSIAG